MRCVDGMRQHYKKLLALYPQATSLFGIALCILWNIHSVRHVLFQTSCLTICPNPFNSAMQLSILVMRNKYFGFQDFIQIDLHKHSSNVKDKVRKGTIKDISFLCVTLILIQSSATVHLISLYKTTTTPCFHCQPVLYYLNRGLKNKALKNLIK